MSAACGQQGKLVVTDSNDDPSTVTLSGTGVSP